MAVRRNHNEKREREEIINKFYTVFSEDGLENPEERFKLLDLFLDSENHLSLNKLHEMSQAAGLFLTPQKISDYMDIFERYGLAEKVENQDGNVLYEHLHLGKHHDHMICVKCGKILEFEDADIEHLQNSVAAYHGFLPLKHSLTMYGLCDKCQGEREKFIRLSDANPGERVRIERFMGGHRLKNRLLSMGLSVGKEVEVLNAGRPGPTIIAVDGSRIALGHMLSRKVWVLVNHF
ncbi:MAG: transcriptional repressor [Deltaproteobacteria bacterium]|uniref:Ferric uptake regulation protein n=1 Tax=Candidatus Zymogenus saltonus TaxID=2844893 RepID=A0A9D8KE02_9DELT|nr:transcriptional repressor [Candidatus Zymogenus saltonus]